MSNNRLKVFLEAAKTGDLSTLNRSIDGLAPNEVQDMISADDYLPFSVAAATGHLAVMERLIMLAPEKVQDMISGGDYDAFWDAARNGHLAVMERLIMLAPEKVQDMISANDYAAFRLAAKNDHLAVVNKLLSFVSVFAYAEQHQYEYRRHTHRFISDKLNALHSQRQAIEAANPNAIFDIANPEEATLCFYMIRNIIRRNKRALDDDLRFLLDIPAVKALAHTAVTDGQPNELVRLALTTGNAVAAGILLNIPAVRSLAEQNDFYRAAARGGLDLRALARDRESSMTALTTGEQKRLQAAITTYQPIIEQAGVDQVMNSLRETLIHRYFNNPAKIRIDGKEQVLPEDWQAFNALSLNAGNRQEALQAYYKNKDHTALRYLSKPNHWMAENASYVYVNPDNITERWSTFDEYQPLIAMFYLAAIDTAVPPVDGHTLEGRLNHFVDEVAHLGRAHNWDKTRIKLDNENKPCLNEKNEPIKEEYDDAEGDKPSCYSGVKRRLFQSVVGNPLLVMLTDDMVKQEVAEFVRQHFIDTIKADHQNGLNAALESFEEGDHIPEGAFNTLTTLNIPKEKLDTFIKYLTQKYGDQAEAYIGDITRRFALPENNEIESKRRTHFFMFYTAANLNGLIVKPAPAESAATSQTGLFSTAGDQQKPAEKKPSQSAASSPESPHGGTKPSIK